MCKRYPEYLVDYEFDAYDLLLPILASHCSADEVPLVGTSESQRLKISVCAAELVYSICTISATNWELLLEHPELSTLERVVNFCVDSVVDCETAMNPELLMVCLLVHQTITGLLAFPRGRGWIAESSTLLVDMVRVLWLWNHAGQTSFLLAKLTQQILEGMRWCHVTIVLHVMSGTITIYNVLIRRRFKNDGIGEKSDTSGSIWDTVATLQAVFDV